MAFSLSLTHPFLLIFAKLGPRNYPSRALCPSLTIKPLPTHPWFELFLFYPKIVTHLPLKVSIWVRKCPKTAFKNYFWGDRFTLLCYQTNSWLVWNGSKFPGNRNFQKWCTDLFYPFSFILTRISFTYTSSFDLLLVKKPKIRQKSKQVSWDINKAYPRPV